MSRKSKRNRQLAKRQAQQQIAGNASRQRGPQLDQPGSFVVEPGEPTTVDATTRRVTVSSVAYSGPIPPPSMLREYEDVCPGSAKLLIENFDRQSKHRQSLESRHQWHSQARSWGGLASGTLLGIGSLLLAAFMSYNGQSLVSAATFISAVAALCGTFYYGRRSQLQDARARKSPPKPT